MRQALLPIQRQIAAGEQVVMVGRDIGSVVIPDAGVKIYLDASAEERARRRFLELQDRGVNVEYDSVLTDIRARDAYDTNRTTSPLRIADGALIVGTDGQSIEQVVDNIVEITRRRWHGPNAPLTAAGDR